jgi:hypothetical protein
LKLQTASKRQGKCLCVCVFSFTFGCTTTFDTISVPFPVELK